jgi:hypothetical protein
MSLVQAREGYVTLTEYKCATCGTIVKTPNGLTVSKFAVNSLRCSNPACKPKPPDWKKKFEGVKKVISEEDAEEANKYCDSESCMR